MMKEETDADKRQCIICGASLAGKQKSAKFCSDKHRTEWHKMNRQKKATKVIKEKECKVCSKRFTVKGNSRRIYCSDKCSGEAQALKIKEYRKNQKNKDNKRCLNCGKDITGSSKMYCSDKCFREKRREQNMESYRRNNDLYKKYDKERKCKECGKDISEKPMNTLFCSEECGQTWYSREVRGHGSWEEYQEERDKQKEERLELLRQDTIKNWTIRDWKYIGGYTKGNSDIQMKCLHCNKIITIKIGEIINRKTYDCTIECIEEVNHKQEQAKLLERRQKKKEEWETLPVKKCLICGKEFKSWQPSQVTCSVKCSKKHSNRKRREYSRLTKYDTEIIDYDITLDGLYERDNGTCHLCNELCDWDDYSRRDGAFIVGPSYPSIDHLIPRSKGGVHSWNNIKLAHHYCNTIKNNNEEVEDTSTEYQRIIAL